MKKFVSLLIILMIVNACSKENRLTRRLDGTWNAVSMTVAFPSFFGISFELMDIGSITLNSDGTGKNSLSYQYEFFGETLEVNDNSTFNWDNNETTVTFYGDETVRWTVVENEKNRQVWTRTDAQSAEWQLTLERTR